MTERSSSDVTRDGLQGVRPDRDALTGVATGKQGGLRGGHDGRGNQQRTHANGRRGGRRRGQGDGAPTVPEAEFTSYYDLPVINKPVWSSPDIPGYLFLGGLAGAASLLGAGAQATGRPALSRVSKAGAFSAGVLSLVGLVHDLGRPARFLHMLRVFKVTSPMSVGSWILAGYVPLTGIAAASSLSGRAPKIGMAATAGSALLGPAVASYTAALISDTAVPAWHDGYPEMPFVFVGSGATAAAGLGLLGAPVSQTGPALAMAVFGVGTELAAFERMERRIGMTAEPYSQGRGGGYVRAGKILSAVGLAGALLGRR
ncbi:MAG: NrfD/PsrC family molybdoenzyme membrane anchor subunit, partial [Pseudonocardiaceae bacterium]